MPSEQELKILVNNSLDEAEHIWGRVGHELIESFSAKASNREVRASELPSHIPGHPIVNTDIPVVDDFIALVLDIRDSSNHLVNAIKAGASMLERVFYETSALLPACSHIISNEDGQVTEYLGDGLLAFFHASEEKRNQACYDCHDASIACINATKNIINPILANRYQLPPLEIGIGMAFSKSIVTVSGAAPNLKPTAFGRCVFDATNFSKGRNQIVVADSLRYIWPKGEKGIVKFAKVFMKGQEGFIMYDTKD